MCVVYIRIQSVSCRCTTCIREWIGREVGGGGEGRGKGSEARILEERRNRMFDLNDSKMGRSNKVRQHGEDKVGEHGKRIKCVGGVCP